VASVIVAWTGRCPEAQTRYKLLGSLHRLAAMSDDYLRMKQPARPLVSNKMSAQRGDRQQSRANIESVDKAISGSILISSEIASDARAFTDGAREAGLPLIDHSEVDGAHMTVIQDAALRGLDFKLFDPRALHPGADRMSFVFLECASVPFLDGRLVQVETRGSCQAHQAEIIRSADWYLTRPSIHLSTYLEDWTDCLFSWVKYFFVGDLWWRRREEMQGYADYRQVFSELHADLGSDTAEETAFDAVLATFGQHADHWIGDVAGRTGEEQGPE
jgi:hypothetical protein